MSFIHFNPAMNFEEYKFQYVYEFAQIIQTAIECETMFWNYDESLALEAVTHFRKISLLHIYIYSQLLNYYHHYYRKNGDICDISDYNKWIEIGLTYGISFKTDFSQYANNESDDNPFFHWYQDNEEVFECPFDFITDEVFFCLFSNHQLLVKFNKIVSLLIKNKEMRNWQISEQFLEKNGTIKRVRIPKWAKDAVFHRDHGKCVFCGKDLTNVYTHANKVNFDHIIPLNKFGANDPCNLQTTCEHCNKSKNDREDNPSYKYEPWW